MQDLTPYVRDPICADFAAGHKQLQTLDPSIRGKVTNVLLGLKAAGYDPKIYKDSGGRSFETQVKMFMSGVSKCASQNCAHVNYGGGSLAVDIVDKQLKWTDWSSKKGQQEAGSGEEAKSRHERQQEFWEDLSSLYEDHNMDAGHKWDNFKDSAHGELRNRPGPTKADRETQKAYEALRDAIRNPPVDP